VVELGDCSLFDKLR